VHGGATLGDGTLPGLAAYNRIANAQGGDYSGLFL
jgi:hypothetical protein